MLEKKDKNIRAGRVLKIIRETMKLSQSELGKMADLKASQISNFETGWRGMGDQVRAKLARAIEIPEGELTRMLQSDADEELIQLWLELNQAGANDLVQPLRKIIHIKKLVKENKLSHEVLDHLKRQIKILCDLAEK